MKKFLALLILCLMVLSVIPANAASTEVLKGTPTVDGILDEIYTQSVSQSITTENQVYNSGAEYADSDYKGTTYLLYDGKFLYACAVVTSSAKIDAAAEDYVMSDANPWMNDVCENWFEIDGGEKIKVSLDAYGKRLFGTPELTGSEGIVGAATLTDTGYIVELAIPCASAAGAEIGYALQLNDLIGEGILAIGSQTPEYYKLSAAEVTYPVVETEAPVTEAPVVEEAAPVVVTAAAQTADITGIVILVSVIALAGVVISRRK
ncbi:MAG: sugar-binding protein [Eubacteriales bacterium]